MRIRIDDITKGTFSLPTQIDTRDKHLKNALDVGLGFIYSRTKESER